MVYKYLIKPYNVTVTMESEGPNESGLVKYEGAFKKIAMLDLSTARGAFGHYFGVTDSTPIDLDYALNSTFGRKNIEVLGEEIKSYDPELPEGAIT